MAYGGMVCPHCGRRIDEADGLSAFGGTFGGFGGLRGMGGATFGGSVNYRRSDGGSTKGDFGGHGDGRVFNLRSRGGPATSSGPETTSGPRTTSHGTGNGRFGELYKIDKWGRKRYL